MAQFVRSNTWIVAVVAALACASPAAAQNIGNTHCNSAETRAALSAYIPTPNPTITSSTESHSVSTGCFTIGLVVSPNGATTSLTDAELMEELVSSGRAEWFQQFFSTNQLTIGPGTVLIGLEQQDEYFIPSGAVNYNTHYTLSNFVTLQLDANDAAANSALGSLHTAFPTVLIDDSLAFISNLLGRGQITASLLSPEPLAYTGELSLPALDAVTDVTSDTPDINLWFAALPRTSTYAGTTSALGFSSAGIGLAGGIDDEFGTMRYGIAFNLDGNRITETSGDFGTAATARLGGYAATDVDNWTLTGALALGLSHIDTTRFPTLATPTTASYGAASFTAGVDATGHYDLGATTFEPMAGAILTAVATQGFTETGPFAIIADPALTRALNLYIGGRLSTELATEHLALHPEVHGRISYDVLNDPRTLAAALVTDPSSPFTVTGITPSPLSATIGGSLSLMLPHGLEADLAADATLRNGAMSGAFTAGLHGSL